MNSILEGSVSLTFNEMKFDILIECDDKIMLSRIKRLFNGYCSYRPYIKDNGQNYDLHFKILRENRYKRDKENFKSYTDLTNREINTYCSRLLVKDNKNIIIAYEDTSIEDMKAINVVRVIRKFIEGNLLERLFYIHAGFIKYKGIGIALAGEKRSGKTTFLLNILNNRNVEFISNDKSFLQVNNKGNIQLLALPYSIGIRKEVLRQYDEINQKINLDSLLLDELPNKVYLHHNELKHIFNISVDSGGELGFVIEPVYRETATGVKVNQVELSLSEFLNKYELYKNSNHLSVIFNHVSNKKVSVANQGNEEKPVFIYEIEYNERLMPKVLETIDRIVTKY